MTMITKKELTEYLRSKNKELEDKLEAVKKHYEKIPVISMLFLTYEEDAIKEYIRNMTIWGEELQKLL
jgi:DNA-binding HxlR family transcriptional regulator